MNVILKSIKNERSSVEGSCEECLHFGVKQRKKAPKRQKRSSWRVDRTDEKEKAQEPRRREFHREGRGLRGNLTTAWVIKLHAHGASQFIGHFWL